MARNVVLTFTTLALICGIAEGQTWRSYVELEGRAGSSREVGQGNLFLPLWQDDSQLLFADMRGQWTDAQTAEGNLGLAFRRILPSDWIVGLHAFYDLRHRRQTGNHQQATAGIELLSVNWGLRLNGYVPDRRAEEVSALNVAFLQGNNIVMRRGEERAYYGVDFEVERLLWHQCRGQNDGILSMLDAELWVAAGMFHYDNDTPGFANMTGPRARVELRLYDLPLLGDDSRLAVSGQYEYDDVRGSIASGTLAVRIPFGRRTRSGPLLGPLDRRMVTPIVRDVDIITNVGLSPVAEPAKIARTGVVISQVVTVDANTPDAKAAIENAGANSVAIVDGSAGVIDTSANVAPTILNQGQVLLGGGSSLTVVGCNTGAAASFSAPGTRGTIFSGANTTVATAANNVCIHGVDLTNNGNFGALALFSSRNVLIEDVGITTTGFGAVGIFSNGNSQFDVRNSTITTGGDFASGILSFNQSNYRISNSAINTGGFRAHGIESGGDNPFAIFSVNNSMINTTGNDADGVRTFSLVQFALNNSTVTTGGDFADGVQSFDSSNYVVNGGSITATGFGARGVNAIASNFAQSFLLNVVEINSTDDGVLMDGVSFGAGTIDATINGARINAGAGAFTHEIDVLADDSAVMCLDANGNFLDNGAGTINFETFTSGTISVSQLAPTAAVNSRELDDANRIPFTNVFQSGGGTINFDAGPCFNVGTFDLAPIEIRGSP